MCHTASPAARRLLPCPLAGAALTWCPGGSTLAKALPLWGVPRSPHQNKSTTQLAQENPCGCDLRWKGSTGRCLFRQRMSRFSRFPGMLNSHPTIKVRVTPLVAPSQNAPRNPCRPS